MTYELQHLNGGILTQEEGRGNNCWKLEKREVKN